MGTVGTLYWFLTALVGIIGAVAGVLANAWITARQHEKAEHRQSLRQRQEEIYTPLLGSIMRLKHDALALSRAGVFMHGSITTHSGNKLIKRIKGTVIELRDNFYDRLPHLTTVPHNQAQLIMRVYNLFCLPKFAHVPVPQLVQRIEELDPLLETLLEAIPKPPVANA